MPDMGAIVRDVSIAAYPNLEGCSVQEMHAIAATADGSLTWENVADIAAGKDEVLIRVRVAGVNRADLL